MQTLSNDRLHVATRFVLYLQKKFGLSIQEAVDHFITLACFEQRCIINNQPLILGRFIDYIREGGPEAVLPSTNAELVARFSTPEVQP